MNNQEIRGLMEAYTEVYAPEQIDEAVRGQDTEMRRTASDERRAGDKRLPAKEGEKYADFKKAQIAYIKRKRMKEEVDLFDTILEYLVAEGYADTNESALVIMANMSEEWRQCIIERGIPNFGISPYSTTGTAQGDFELGGGITKMKRDNMTRDQVIKQGRKNIDNQSGYTWGHQGPGTPQSNQRKDMYKRHGVTFPEDK